MGIARNIARLIPNGSGLLPNANIEAVAASKLTGQVPDANAPSESVIQVVQTAYTTADSTTSSSPTMANTGCTATITPSSSSNKILAMLSMATHHAAMSQNAAARIMRGSSAAFSGITGDYWSTSGAGISGNINIQWLDSPATTSPITYTAQFAVGGGGTLRINLDYNGNNNGVTYLTLLEIAA